MQRRSFSVPARCAGWTLRDFVRRELGLSARVLTEQKQVPDGILRNGEPFRANGLLAPGDTVTFQLPSESVQGPAVPLPVSVLWETPDLLAVDKPAGMPIHPSPGHDRDSLLNAVAWYYERTGQSVGFRPLYRLDRDTTGLVVLAKNRLAAGARLTKTYVALCQGELSGAGVIDVPIGLEPGSRIKRRAGEGQRAVTRWRSLAVGEDCTLLALNLETGRTHQIRVHLASLGHPLLGDDLYGGPTELLSRQALHCWRVRVELPLLGVDQTLTAPFPEDLRRVFPTLPEGQEFQEEGPSCLPV